MKLEDQIVSVLGLWRGKGFQALIFWIVHLVIFRLVTVQRISLLAFITFAVTFGVGMVLGHSNFRKRGERILPSWILHGSVNFFSFLTLALL